ncbi:MAG: tetratricopeptide repeat protein [Nitrosopumilus sp. H8]|nr:MAG: tetratricopeptide repeat protein [Nitrosopumilus sp. H8]
MTVDSKDMLEKAYECAENSEYSEAMSLYDEALKRDPDNIRIIIDRGATLQNMGENRRAIRAYERALEISPNHPDALLNKGSALHCESRYDEAISCYDVVLESDKMCAVAYAYKGLSLGEKGDMAGALAHFKRALAIDGRYELAAVSMDAAQKMLDSKTR